MATANNMSMLSMAEGYLKERIRHELQGQIVERLVNDFRAEAESVVKEELKKLTLDGIESMSDMMRMRDELFVYVKWNDEKHSITK